jgi:hypothetical protein
MQCLHPTRDLFRRLVSAGKRSIVQTTCLLALTALGSTPAIASTAFGDLNNFDVFNDTGQDCYGFEIELDDVRSTDITYTYDWNHYGAPTITEDNSDPGHPKVFVRYAAKYSSGTFSAFTAVPSTTPSPTDGHMCTDPTVNFGCEHFGVGYYGTPTAVRYNWLVEAPFSPGNLIHGPAVNVSTPTWTYYPPAPAQPVAQVQAAIPALPPPEVPVPGHEFGDAVWVKAIKTTSHNNARVELKDLVSDDPDDPNDRSWTNGEPDEVEVEWQILQTEFKKANGANNELEGGREDLAEGDEVVTRRYEFYKYTGPLDPESNEAKCDKYPPVSDPFNPEYKGECDPAVVTILGDYVGAQMAGFNVEAVLGLIDHLQDGDLNQPYTPRTIVVGGNTPYSTEVTLGALPAGLTIDSASGVLSGTPTAAGQFSFTVTVTDADLVQVSKPYTMTVANLADLCAGVICSASDACHEAGVCDPATGLCSNPAAPDGTLCDDGNACTQSDACLAGACKGSNPVSCTAADACHEAGVCNPATGLCSNPAAPDGTLCDDGNTCTQGDMCLGGVCTGGNPDPGCDSADLSLKLQGVPKQVSQRKEIKYGIRVKNLGPDAATSVSVDVTCAGLSYQVVETSPGCVATPSSTTCDIGMLRQRGSAGTSVTIMPAGKGVLTCTASVTSATSDPNPGNQSRTVTTEVR